MAWDYERDRRGGRRRNTGYGVDRRGVIEEAVDRRVDRESGGRDRKNTRQLAVERQALAAELGLAFDDLVALDRHHE